MKVCCHCGNVKSPCWRKGPPEKPLLCNACGARYLVKRSLEGYWPGQRASSTTSGTSQQGHSYYQLQHHQHDQLAPHGLQAQQQQQQQQHAHHAGSSGPRGPRGQQQHTRLRSVPAGCWSPDDHTGGGGGCSTAGSAWSDVSSVEQAELVEVEQPAMHAAAVMAAVAAAVTAAAAASSGGGGRKRSRLVACSVIEVDPDTSAATRCRRTFEAPNGGLVIVERRPRKQLRPRSSSSS